MQVVAVDLLDNDFEITSALFFYQSNKNLEEIWQIIMFTKVANLIKQIIKAIIDLAMIAKKIQSKKML